MLKNLLLLYGMLLDKRCRINFKLLYSTFKADRNFSVLKLLKLSKEILKGRKLKYINGHYIFSYAVPPFSSHAFRSFISTGITEENVFTDLILNRKKAPDIFSLAVTDKCPNNCNYCSTKGRMERNELTTAEWIDTVRQIQDMGTSIIQFTGGEPLCREDLEEIVEAIDERSLSFVFTRGEELTESRSKALKKSGLFGTCINLNLDNGNTGISGAGAIETRLSAVKNSLYAGLYTMVSALISKKGVTYENIFDICRSAESLGAHELLLIKPIRAGKLASPEVDSDIFYTEETMQKMNDIYKKAVKKFKKINIFATSLIEWDKTTGCLGGNQMSYISSSGELFPCDFLPLSFGNVKSERLQKIWKQMNEVMGIPKRECMCNSLCEVLRANDLPMPKDISIELCHKLRETDYPDFYKNFSQV